MRNNPDQTELLLKYFPKGYDFGVDQYDPVVEDVRRLLLKAQSAEEAWEVTETPEFVETLLRGAKRHININIRFDLFLRLQRINNKATKHERQLIDTVMEELQDTSAEIVLMEFVSRLYSQHLATLAFLSPEKNPSQELIDKIKSSMIKKDNIDEILSFSQKEVEVAIEAIAFPETGDLPSEHQLAYLILILASIPTYFSARLIFYLITNANFQERMLTPIVKNTQVLPFLVDYFLNTISTPDASWVDRWLAYGILTGLKEYKIINRLREELLGNGIWEDHDDSKDDGDEAFYSDIIKYLIEMDDRRSVPVFIQFLSEKEKWGFSNQAFSSFEALIMTSPWWEEIRAGVTKIQEGETILVPAGTSPIEYLQKKISDFSDVEQLLANGYLTIEQLNERAKTISDNWSKNYLEDNGWLRPIDIPLPDIKRAFVERCYRDFEKEKGSRVQKLGAQDQSAAFNEFQSDFMMTPLPDHNNEIPMVVIEREMEKLSITPAQKDHWQKLFDYQLNALYFNARDLIKKGSIEEGKKRLSVLLALMPTHPFALDLLKSTEINTPSSMPKIIEQEKLHLQADILKPFFYDIIFRLRPHLRDSIDREIESLKTAGINAPVLASDVQLLFLAEFIEKTAFEFRDTLLRLHEEERNQLLIRLVQSIELEYFTLVDFELFGKKTFYFAPSLVERLMETELNVEGQLLKLPFPSCAFIYQDPQFIQLFQRCFGITDIVPEYDTPVSVFLTEIEKDDHSVIVIFAARLSTDMVYYGEVKRELRIDNNKSIEDALRTTWEENETDFRQTINDSFFYDDTRIVFYRTILNSILYLLSNNADITNMRSPLDTLAKQFDSVKSTRKKGKLQRRIERKGEEASELPYIIVGKNASRSELHQHYMTEDSQTWRKIMKRFMTRGHWRHQPFGKGLSEKKLLWIQPYWKGPKDISEVLNKRYIVK